jgi:hypothetical protein
MLFLASKPNFLGGEFSLFRNQLVKGGSHKDGIDLVGEVRPMKQTNTTEINQSLLSYYKRVGLYDTLKLDLYFNESVGNSYDGVLYLPAKLDPQLCLPKFKKYFPKRRDINQNDWDLALEWVYEHYSSLGVHKVIPNNKLRSYILENCDPESLEGSSGFCFPGVSKGDFIENTFEIYDRFSKQFSFSPVSPWRLFIKEELREGQKVSENPSSRVIWGSGVILFIAQVSLFKEIQDHFVLNHRDFWSSCGLNFSGSEYGLAMSKFANRKVNSVDGSSFDASMQEQDLLDLFVLWDKMIDSRYKDEEYYSKLAYVMSNDIYSLAVMPNGYCAFKGCGNATGSYLTLMRNTFHNFRLYAYVYIRQCRKLSRKPIYSEYVSTHFGLMNGDDCIITSSKFMNWCAIKEHMGNFLELTTFEINGKYEHPLWEVSYCGCTALLDENENIVPLRDSYKFFLALLFMGSDDKLSERCIGYIVANPFDDLFVTVITSFMKENNMSIPDIPYIRSSYFYKEVLCNPDPPKIKYEATYKS